MDSHREGSDESCIDCVCALGSEESFCFKIDMVAHLMAVVVGIDYAYFAVDFE